MSLKMFDVRFFSSLSSHLNAQPQEKLKHINNHKQNHMTKTWTIF